jgi:hypothetical protein
MAAGSRHLTMATTTGVSTRCQHRFGYDADTLTPPTPEYTHTHTRAGAGCKFTKPVSAGVGCQQSRRFPAFLSRQKRDVLDMDDCSPSV